MWATSSVPAQRKAGFRIIKNVVGWHQRALIQPPTGSSKSFASKLSARGFSHGHPRTSILVSEHTSRPSSQLNPRILKGSRLSSSYALRPHTENGTAAGPTRSRSHGTSARQYSTDVSSSQQVTVGNQQFSSVYLRDACTCPRCVDPSSKQKNFQSTDIPSTIKARTVEPQGDGSVKVTWDGDLPGFEDNHISTFPAEFFEVNSSWANFHQDHFGLDEPKIWDKALIAKRLQHVDYEDYLTKDESLYVVLQQLHDYGLVLLRGVPESEKSVEHIAERIGRLRDTFYGRTWNVKSVPQAKNVAYTAQYLGLHMDLLYMRDPPGFQFLHCLKNTCKGGISLFSDAFQAASSLSKEHFDILSNYQVPYNYRNAGEHYYYSHPVIELRNSPGQPKTIDNVNYSPPFQATLAFPTSEEKKVFDPTMDAWREFAAKVEDEENLFEYRLQEGECVVFNNRRVLHGRRQFDTATGERWLKGCYIDTDVFMSRYRVLSKISADGELKAPK